MEQYIADVRKQIGQLPKEPLQNTEFPSSWIVKFASDFKEKDGRKICILNMDAREKDERTGTHYYCVHNVDIPADDSIERFKGLFYFDPVNLPVYQGFEQRPYITIDMNVQNPDTVFCGHFCMFVGKILEYPDATDKQKIEFLRHVFRDGDWGYNERMIGL